MDRQRLFPEIAPEERLRFRLTAGGFVCIAASALIARVAGDAMFLSRYGSELLPYMYIGSALVLVLVSIVFGAGARHFSPIPLAVTTSCLLIGATIALRAALTSPEDAWRIAAYFLADVVVNVPMMLFWGLAALTFNPREAKRLFGVVGAAGTGTCIVIGAVVRPAAARFGTENLLLGVIALLVAFVAVVLTLARVEPQRFQPAARGTATKTSHNPSAAALGYWAGLLKQPQIRHLATLTMLASLATMLIDYQFKSAARARYTGAELAGFMGTFYSGANVVTLLVQLFLVHRILRMGGVLVGLSVLPTGVLIASLGTAASALAFPWIIASRLMDPVFNFTVNSASLQMLYLGIKKQTRGQARAFVEGTCKPLAIALGGTTLVAAAGTSWIDRIATAAAIIASFWLLSAWRNNAAYVGGLIDSVGARRFEPSADDLAIQDRDLAAHVKRSLVEASDEDLPYLIGVLPQLGKIDAAPELEQLLQRNSSQVKVAALGHLRHRKADRSLPAILDLCRHGDSDVRAAAVHAAAAIGGKAVIHTLEQCLADESAAVRAAAAAELINSGDLDALLAAGVAMKGMLTARDPQDRIAATSSLGDIHHAELSRLLTVLLRDPESEVLRVALEAAGLHPSDDLMPAVIELLGDARVGATAAETLVGFGATTLPSLALILEQGVSNTETVRPGLLRVPSIIARIGDARGLAMLERALEAAGTVDALLREEIIGAWCRLITALGAVKSHIAALDRTIAHELGQAGRCRATLAKIVNVEGSEVLSMALKDEYSIHIKNVFSLLDTRTPDVDMHSVHFGLTRGSSEARAEALELLDNVLEVESKRKLLDFLEPARSGATVATAEEAEREVLALMQKGVPEWVRVGALHAAGSARIHAALAAADSALGDRSPVVRETALGALSALLPHQEAVACARRMSDDPDTRVRHLAESMLAA